MRISDWSSDVCSSDLFIGRDADHRVGELGCRSRLAPEVEFAQGPAAEIGDDLARAEARGFAAQRLEMRGLPFIGFDVARELLVDAGAAHLDRDRAAVGRSEEHTSELQSLMRNSYAVFCLKQQR